MAVVYDPYDGAILEDPYPIYRALRDEAPVYYNEAHDFWALSRFDDVLVAMRDARRYASAAGAPLERGRRFHATRVESFLALDPGQQTRMRALVNRGLTTRRVAALEPFVRDLAVEMLAGFADDGECDFIGQFAGRLHMDVSSELVGVPLEDRESLRGWADVVVQCEEGNSAESPYAPDAASSILGYFASYVDRRRAAPIDDLTTALIECEIDGERLSDDEITGFLFLMVTAGNEVTTKLLGNALYWLAENPGERLRVLATRSLVSSWVEETLRYDPSSQRIARTATCDIRIRDRTIPRGAHVALLIGSANRDEREFERPDDFDVTRTAAQSLAFGNGTHGCLGAPLARLEARVALEEVLASVPDYALQRDRIERAHSSNGRGFRALPIRFDSGLASRPASRQISGR